MKFLAISFLAAIRCARDRQPHPESPSPPLRLRSGAGVEVTKNPNMIYLIIFVELRWRFGKSPVHS